MLALTLSGTPENPSVEKAEAAPPVDAPGRVIVAVAAAGITRMEPHWMTGWETAEGMPRPQPATIGHEFAGTITSIGPDVDGFEVGQRVMGMIEPERDGAMAQYTSAAVDQIIAIPDGIGDVAASTLPLAGLTAWQAIIRYGQVKASDRVLIHGGAGGVGTFALQIAHWVGAEVFTTARASHAALCRELGADHVIDFERERFEDIARGMDLVFDTIGGETQERSWGALKGGGRLITIAGEASDEPDQERARELGVEARWFLVSLDRDELLHLSALVARDVVKPIIGRLFPLEDALKGFLPTTILPPGKSVVTIRSADRR